jgi:hypothetical protein
MEVPLNLSIMVSNIVWRLSEFVTTSSEWLIRPMAIWYPFASRSLGGIWSNGHLSKIFFLLSNGK